MVLNLPPGVVMLEGKAFSRLVFLLKDKVMAFLTSYKVQATVEGEHLINLLIAFEEEEGLLGVVLSSIVMEEVEHLLAVTHLPMDRKREDFNVISPSLMKMEE